jgi:putative ABC transport system permease protein
MSALGRDLRFSLRMLGKNPGFMLAAIITLALGIGANTAIFTVTSALLLRPFPYRDPQQLVNITVKSADRDHGGTLNRYDLLRDHVRSLEGIAAWTTDSLNLTGHGEPLQVATGRVTANFFGLLGVQPHLGRNFTEDESRPEGKPVVILSDALWRKRFGSDRNVIDQTITLDGTPYTIIGVLPGDVQFPFAGEMDVWIPRYFEFSLMPTARLRMGVGYLSFLARMRPGVSLEQANSELAVLNQQYRNQYPTAPDADKAARMNAEPLRDLVVSNVRGKILMLSAAVAVVLLIACANVASLLLSRALARRREIAVRAALGASRSTIITQLLTESTLLAIIAGGLGIGLSWAATHALLRWGASQLPQGIPLSIDRPVLLFTLVISLITGVLFGIVPAIQLSRVNLNTALRDEGRGTSAGHSRSQAKSFLVVGQVALSLLLLIGAGLLLRSFQSLLRVDPGFDAHNVLTMSVSLPTVKYAKPEQQIAFFDELLRKVSALPGVKDVAMSAALPTRWIRITPVLAEGQPEAPLAERPFIDIEAISPQWFQTMRVPLRAGRQFTDADNAQAPKVVVANESFVKRFFPNQNPIGKRVSVGRWPPAEIVGVAADIKNKGLAQDTQPQLYLSFPQIPWGNMNLLVRTETTPDSMASSVRAQVASIDPDQPVTGIQSVEELLDSERAQPRFTMLLLATFSASALILAVIGIYGVLAYSVEQRRHELGIRMALGAERGDILRMVVRQGLLLSAIGIAIGLIGALIATKLMSSLLYGIGARDIETFSIAPVLFLVIALLASYLPARRATKVDPLEAMRGS